MALRRTDSAFVCLQARYNSHPVLIVRLQLIRTHCLNALTLDCGQHGRRGSDHVPKGHDILRCQSLEVAPFRRTLCLDGRSKGTSIDPGSTRGEYPCYRHERAKGQPKRGHGRRRPRRPTRFQVGSDGGERPRGYSNAWHLSVRDRQ
jgi:hypothetical protein